MQSNKFRALAAAVVAALGLAGCGGDGGGGAKPPPDNGGSTNVLFIGTNDGLVAAFHASTVAGVSYAATFADHAIVNNGVPDSVMLTAYDAARDELYVRSSGVVVAGSMPERVDVYAQASHMTAGATPAPARSLTFPGVAGFFSMHYDRVNDTLWVTGELQQDREPILWAFDHASTLSGNVTHSRSVTPVDRLTPPLDVAIDNGRSLLYVLDDGTGEIDVFADPAHVDADAVPVRTFISAGIGSALALDATRDILYVGGYRIDFYMVRGASTASGRPTTAVIQLAGAIEGPSVAVDAAHDRLYVGDGWSLFQVDDASTLTDGTALDTTKRLVTDQASMSFAFP